MSSNAIRQESRSFYLPVLALVYGSITRKRRSCSRKFVLIMTVSDNVNSVYWDGSLFSADDRLYHVEVHNDIIRLGTVVGV